MDNQVPADDLINIPLGTLPDGRKAKLKINSSGQDIMVAVLFQEIGYVDFHGVLARVFTADDYKMVESILKSGGLWDQSWQDLEDGGSYTWGSVTQTGTSAVSLRFAYELREYTTRAARQATDVQWFKGVFIPFCQQLVDEAVANNPPIAPPTPVYDPYNPDGIGQVYQANIIAYMQFTRIRLINGKVEATPIP